MQQVACGLRRPACHRHRSLTCLLHSSPLLQAQYTRSSGASPDYLFLLQRLMIDNPDAAVNLAKMVAKQVKRGAWCSCRVPAGAQLAWPRVRHRSSVAWLSGCASAVAGSASSPPQLTLAPPFLYSFPLPPAAWSPAGPQHHG